MKKIFKYRIDFKDKQSVMMPNGAEILCVREQNDIPYIWAICNPDAEQEERFLRIVATGGEPSDMGDLKYIGTFIVPDNNPTRTFVGHLFEQL